MRKTVIDANRSQKEIFIDSEGDRYYLRNKLKLDDALRSWKKGPVTRAVRAPLGFFPGKHEDGRRAYVGCCSH